MLSSQRAGGNELVALQPVNNKFLVKTSLKSAASQCMSNIQNNSFKCFSVCRHTVVTKCAITGRLT